VRPIVQKAEVIPAAGTDAGRVAAGDPAVLVPRDDGSVSVRVTLHSRFPFGIGGDQEREIGSLDPSVVRIMRPALDGPARLRVRIVEVEPAHVNRNGRRTIYLSIWGA